MLRATELAHCGLQAYRRVHAGPWVLFPYLSNENKSPGFHASQIITETGGIGCVEPGTKTCCSRFSLILTPGLPELSKLFGKEGVDVGSQPRGAVPRIAAWRTLSMRSLYPPSSPPPPLPLPFPLPLLSLSLPPPPPYVLFYLLRQILTVKPWLMQSSLYRLRLALRVHIDGPASAYGVPAVPGLKATSSLEVSCPAVCAVAC